MSFDMKGKGYSLKQTPVTHGNKTVVSNIKPVRTFVSDVVDLKREGGLDDNAIQKLPERIRVAIKRHEEGSIPTQSKTVFFNPKDDKPIFTEEKKEKDVVLDKAPKKKEEKPETEIKSSAEVSKPEVPVKDKPVVRFAGEDMIGEKDGKEEKAKKESVPVIEDKEKNKKPDVGNEKREDIPKKVEGEREEEASPVPSRVSPKKDDVKMPPKNVHPEKSIDVKRKQINKVIKEKEEELARVTEEIEELDRRLDRAKIDGKELENKRKPLIERERQAESEIAKITEEENNARSDEELKRSLSKKRWEIEEERQRQEKERWDIDKEISRIDEEILDIQKVKEGLNDKREKIDTERLRFEGMKDILSSEERKEKIKERLTELEGKKKELENEWDIKNDQKEAAKEKIVSLQEKKEEVERHIDEIEEKESTTHDAATVHKIEKSRWEAEKRRRDIEQRRWELEDTLKELENKMLYLENRYRGFLKESESLGSSIRKIDDFIKKTKDEREISDSDVKF